MKLDQPLKRNVKELFSETDSKQSHQKVTNSSKSWFETMMRQFNQFLKPSLSDKQINKLKNHKMTEVSSKSIIDKKLIVPYVYEPLSKHAPHWMLSTKLLPLFNFSCISISALLCYWFALKSETPEQTLPIGQNHVPRIVFFITGLLMLCFRVLDGLGSMMKLKENAFFRLTDPGIKALGYSLAMIPWLIQCGNGVGSTGMFFVFLSGWLSFLFDSLKQDETTDEKNIVAGWWSEGLWLYSLGFVISGLLDGNLWNRPLKNFSAKLTTFYLPFLANARMSTVLNVVVVLAGVVASFNSIVHVIQAMRDHSRRIEKDHPNRGWLSSPTSKALNIIILMSLISTWVVASSEEIFSQHPYLMIVTLGLQMGCLLSSHSLSSIFEDNDFSVVSLTSCIAPVSLCLLNCFTWRIMGIGIITESTSLIFLSIFSLLNCGRFVISLSPTLTESNKDTSSTAIHATSKDHGSLDNQTYDEHLTTSIP